MRAVNRYGIAIKALPKGGKPFRDDDEDQDKDTAATDGADTGAPTDDAHPSTEPAAVSSEEAPAPESADEEVPNEATPGDGAAATESAEMQGDEPAPGPEDDARPWSGDMYDEGDETDPADAFAAYKGTDGEEAWLDQAPDGTLTGWVRDVTGQVWRYTDPDVWAIDVDDAQMTRTHSQANDSSGDAAGEHGGQDTLFPPKQKEQNKWS
ncbi:hypothetical protein [Streptomyces griseocarneus]|uniref:hypothetical protein n=1 Tax=Streptomyces griseocarneus TaxID=51201 RepID=UPI00167D8B46|nr:hypothetical protein [Streptomyces griseocarneus]MBZ6476676.1 hypothetical protein [Streptomyces griseocarneus]GHG80268.1 hypothetical protein GCM10018779_61710 [Streptomyces griseocarneus]